MAGLSFSLVVLLLAFPWVIHLIVGIEASDGADVLARRAGMLFLGFGTIAFFCREAPLSHARQAVVMGQSVSMLGLACLGSIEFARGACGPGVMLAVSAELILGGLLLRHWLRFRRTEALGTSA